jgi:hypothetical protein
MMSNNKTVKRTILYYPTIRIPSDTWIKQALLYWDQIGSIVPQTWEGRPVIPLSQEIDYLKSEEAFRPFDPDSLLNRDDTWGSLQELEDEFRSITSSAEFVRIVPSLKRQISSHVHIKKVGHELFYNFLEPQGLARRDESNPDWYVFEDNCALLYMSLLAKYLSDIDIQSTFPGTDHKGYESLLFRTSSRQKGFACLDTRFSNVLPVPRNDVSLQDILAFKRRRQSELLHFRETLDEFEKALSQCAQAGEVKSVATNFQGKIMKGVADLSELLKDSGISTVLGSLKTIISVKSPTLIATAAVAGGYATKVAEVPIEWAAAGLGVMGLIEIGSYFVDRINERRATMRNSPFSYLYHARKEGIVDTDAKRT